MLDILAKKKTPCKYPSIHTSRKTNIHTHTHSHTLLNKRVLRWLAEAEMFMNVHCFVCECGKLANLRRSTESAGCVITRRKAQHNHGGKQRVLDWQSLLEGFYFSNQQSNYKGSLLGSHQCNLVTVARSPPDRRVIAKAPQIHWL